MQFGTALKKAVEKGKEGREEHSHRSPQDRLADLYLQPMWKQLPPNNTSCGTISSRFTEALLKKWRLY